MPFSWLLEPVIVCIYISCKWLYICGFVFMPVCTAAFFHITLCFTEVLKNEICCSIRRRSVYLVYSYHRKLSPYISHFRIVTILIQYFDFNWNNMQRCKFSHKCGIFTVFHVLWSCCHFLTTLRLVSTEYIDKILSLKINLNPVCWQFT